MTNKKYEVTSNGELAKGIKTKVVQNGSVENNVIKNGDIPRISNGIKYQPKIDTEWKTKSTAKGPDRVKPAENLSTTDADGCVKIRESFEVNEEPISIPTVLKRQAELLGNSPALAFKENNQWKTINFNEYYKTVRTTAKAFLKLGLQRYNSVCILGMNSKEWFYSDLGAIMAGGAAAGIYVTNSSESCLHCLKISSADIVVVEDNAQLQKILKIKEQAPSLKTIIQYTGVPVDSSVLSWQDVMKIGEEESDEKLDQVIETLAVNECCSILFTSGTTGSPKAVMLSHDNLIFETKMVAKYLEFQMGNERILSYLPLSHAAAQISDMYMGLVSGSCVYFADKNVLKGTLVENLRHVRPTILFGVPRVWEKIKEGLEANEKNASRLSQLILRKARSAATAHHKAISEGYVGESLLFKLFRRVVYSKVKEALGLDLARTYLSGAAPISKEIKEYFTSLDMPIGEAFGMSESSGAHVLSKGTDIDLDSIGCTLPGMRTKINDPDERGLGELCMYGRHVFMGYLNDPSNTSETIDNDGWLHSGDLGKCNSKSHVQITGRIKELLITAGGENIAPVLIEQIVKSEIPVVSHAVLVADNRKYVSVLITLKCDVDPNNGMPLDDLAPETKAWCKSLGCQCEKVSEILQQKPSSVYDAIQSGIDRVNTKALSSAQKIQKFSILPIDFSVVSGELGPTMKLMRRVVYKKYEDIIERIYA